MLLKRIAGIAFTLSFTMAIVVFGGVGREYISVSLARTLFLIFGAAGIVLNLFSFQSGKQGTVFNFIFWVGSVVLFTGFTFRIMHWPMSFYIILAGLLILGVSFIIPAKEKEEKGEDLLDDF